MEVNYLIIVILINFEALILLTIILIELLIINLLTFSSHLRDFYLFH